MAVRFTALTSVIQCVRQRDTGSIVEIKTDDSKAPEPSGDVVEDAALACDYLQTAGELDAIHRQALLTQVSHRSAYHT